MAGPQDSYPGVPPSQASWGRDSQGNPVPVVVVHAPGGEGGYGGGGGSDAARRSGAILWMGMLIGGLAIANVLLGILYLDERTKREEAPSQKEMDYISARVKEEEGRVQTWRDAYFGVEKQCRTEFEELRKTCRTGVGSTRPLPKFTPPRSEPRPPPAG